MEEKVWVVNKTDKKIAVEVKEIIFYYKNVTYPNDTVMEGIGGKGYERRIVVEIVAVEDA